MADGNTSRIIVWVTDTVIIRKQLQGQNYYFVADAESGQPIAKADLEFFGFRQAALHPPAPAEVLTKEFKETTDNDGQVLIGADKQGLFTWLVTAKKKADKDGFDRLAYLGLGFTSVWYSPGYNYDDNQRKRDEIRGFIITDRPVYRPEQTMHFKFWVRHARSTIMPDTSHYAGQTFKVEIYNPKGDKISEKALTADEYGGLADDYVLPKGAMLGIYAVYIPYLNPDLYPTVAGGQFRVEEYKKPEFEVTVEAPKEPVSLGETITATIKAKYYFGAPVTHAKVKYKVMRTELHGALVSARRLGLVLRPRLLVVRRRLCLVSRLGRLGLQTALALLVAAAAMQPPEVVMENEVAIGPDGTVKVAIDTLPAKELHGDVDHKYSITAEVADESRRTIVGSGERARRAQAVPGLCLGRSRLLPAPAIPSRPSSRAQTLDQKPVQGKGELKLFQITYNDKSEPVEKDVESWKLDTDAQGKAQQQLKAAKPGQYRLSYTVTDAKAEESAAKARNELRAKIIWDAKKREQDQFRKLPLAIPPEHKKDKAEELKNLFSGKKDPQEELEKLIALNLKNHTIEGGYLFVVRGEGFTGKDFRFNDIELIPDRKEYKPGENVKLLVNVNRNDGVVLLFTRPENGVYLAPKVIRLKGKSASEEIAVAQKDMPNFFIEAVTIADGRVHSDMRELIVPPEKRVLNVESAAVAKGVQAGPEGDSEGEADRPARQALCGIDSSHHVRQERRIHLRRLERAGDQVVLLELAPPSLFANRVEPGRLVRQPAAPERSRHGQPGPIRRSSF